MEARVKLNSPGKKNGINQLWIDNFVISTEPIGPIVCPRNPTVKSTPYKGTGHLASWQLAIGSWHVGTLADSTLADDPTVVWSSKPLTVSDSVRVDTEQGDFTADLSGQRSLTADESYQFRVRQTDDRGEIYDWSPWYQAVRITAR